MKHHSHGSHSPCTANCGVAFDRFAVTNRLSSLARSTRNCNVDVTDPPFNRRPGDKPAMTAQDEADIIAFLKTLTDGYKAEN